MSKVSGESRQTSRLHPTDVRIAISIDPPDWALVSRLDPVYQAMFAEAERRKAARARRDEFACDAIIVDPLVGRERAPGDPPDTPRFALAARWVG